MLPITEIINVSVSQTPVGLGAFNVNNVGYFTTGAFLSNPGSDVFRSYTSAASVGTDFGTGTETYQQAVAFFSQVPNVLNGGGQLIIFPRVSTETLDAAILRCLNLAFFVGIISDFYPTISSGGLTLANDVQAYGNKILMLPSATYSDVAGAFSAIQAAGNYATRCLYLSTSALAARLFAAAYAGRGFATNFLESNGTLTMNLKQLATILPDETITQTQYNAMLVAGVDFYTDIAGFPCVISTGGNRYFDQVYNQIWFVSALQVAGFNALAQVDGKIPQTEPGMSVLKSAYRAVCDQSVANEYVAPGAWTSPNTFGNQSDFISNILQKGYYIYSSPVNLQSAAVRATRVAPLVQIAIKEAGAIQSSNVVVNINP